METADPNEEIRLLRQLRDGSVRAFEALYHRYKHPLAKSLVRLLKDPVLVEDVLQESFEKIWMRRNAIVPDRAFSGYLYRVAVNIIYDVYRKSAVDRKLSDYLLRNAQPSQSYLEEQLIHKEQLDLLKASLNQLPPQRRKVFELFKLEGKSYREISLELGISKSTINSHLTKVTQFLREKFGEHVLECVLATAIFSHTTLLG